ncbi:hypothetical protein SELMODRAFT_402494 [Selaginella moellendorffii]|uniref:Uncharacterized protein n=1 Tax=Selaginella moellendorffii TaxID=88036 RepID=D8QQU4_SELML|nr:hypothetical protein SELMODRAFT_402494 [Selaginella moellendorffii]
MDNDPTTISLVAKTIHPWYPRSGIPLPPRKALEGVNFDLASSLTDGNLEEHPADRLQARKETLTRTLAYLKQQLPRFMVQANQKIDELNDFLGVHINNIPRDRISTNTKFMVRPVLDYYASLWNAKGDEEGKSYYGFPKATRCGMPEIFSVAKSSSWNPPCLQMPSLPEPGGARLHSQSAEKSFARTTSRRLRSTRRTRTTRLQRGPDTSTSPPSWGCAVAVAPEFDLSLDAVHSIAMSGHKWIGALVPCGIFMSKTRYQLNPPSNPNYSGTPDTSFAGSRNGLSAVYMWSDISKYTLKQQIDKAVQCQGKARFVNDTMTELDKKLKLDLWVALSPTVRFRQLNDDLTASPTRRWLSMVCNASIHNVTKEVVLMLAEDVERFGHKAFKDLSDGIGGGGSGGVDAPRVSFLPFQGRGFTGKF